MKSKTLSILVIFCLVCFPEIILPQGHPKAYGVWVSVYFDIQNTKMKIKERIKEVDIKIANNEKSLEETNKLLADIQRIKITGTEKQKYDASLAEPIAQQSLQKAKETQRRLRNQRIELIMELERINNDEQRLKDLYERLVSEKTVGVIRNCSGDVKILSNNHPNHCFKYSTLNEGDTVITGSNATANITVLDGRGNLTLKPNSRYTITKNSTEEEVGELISGKMHVKIENSVKYNTKTNELLNRYKEDLKTIKDWTEEQIEQINKKLRDKVKNLRLWVCTLFHPNSVCSSEGKFAPGAVIGARGTEFFYEIDKNMARLYVLEGEVEVNITKNKQTIVLSEGFEAIITPDSTIKTSKKSAFQGTD